MSRGGLGEERGVDGWESGTGGEDEDGVEREEEEEGEMWNMV